MLCSHCSPLCWCWRLEGLCTSLRICGGRTSSVTKPSVRACTMAFFCHHIISYFSRPWAAYHCHACPSRLIHHLPLPATPPSSAFLACPLPLLPLTCHLAMTAFYLLPACLLFTVSASVGFYIPPACPPPLQSPSSLPSHHRMNNWRRQRHQWRRASLRATLMTSLSCCRVWQRLRHRRIATRRSAVFCV